MGRPPVQHHKQIVELGPELADALEDGSIRDLFVLHEGAQAAKGFLSTNAGAIAATFGAISVLLAFPPTQRLITQFIAFWRLQITETAVDILSSLVPSPEDVVDSVTEAAKKIPETAKEAWDRINRELSGDVVFGPTPVGLPITEEMKRALRKAGEQPPQ